MNKPFPIVLALLFFSCESEDSQSKAEVDAECKWNNTDKYSYIDLSAYLPSEEWVGKTLKVYFSRAGKSLKGAKILKLKDYKIDEYGYKYFAVDDYSNGYANELYFEWFTNYDYGVYVSCWTERVENNE